MSTLDSIITLNHEAVAGVLERARAIPPEKWTVPRAPGKWSPGQVVEHVLKSYEGHRRMAQGLLPVSSAPRWQQWLARSFFLPGFFKKGDFTQKGLKSPSFILPSGVPPSAEELLARLEAAATGLEQDLVAAEAEGKEEIIHPFFGAISPAYLLQFVAIHTRHHAPQIVAA